MNKILFSILLIPACLAAQAPAGYYNGTTGLTGYALKTKLHEIISEKNKNWHYGDLQNYYKQTDLDVYYDHTPANNPVLNTTTGNMDYTILDMYSEIPNGPDSYEYTTENMIGSAATEGLGWNREHMMPQSTFYSNYPMYSDLFFVVPTDAKINQLRSNYMYGISVTAPPTSIYYTFSNGSKIGKNAIPNSPYTLRVYEPIDEFKGDVARSLLYFAVRFEGKLGTFNYNNNVNPASDTNPLDGTEERAYENWYIAMLLQWHNQDPVSQKEINRNNAVYTIQGNRNPFIDNPAWVNTIWNQTPDSVAPNAPSNLTITQNSAYFTSLSWTPSTSTDVIGYKIYQNGTLVGTSKTNTFHADHLTPSMAYSFTVKAYDNGYLYSQDSNTVSTTTLASDSFSKDIYFSKYVEGTGDNKLLEITNTTGHPVNLSDYRLSIQFYGNNNYYYPDPYELDGIIQNGERAVILNPNASLSCVSNNDARFVTAAPQMTFTGSNYLELRYKSTGVDAIGVSGQSNSATLGNVSLYRKSTVNQPTLSFSTAEWDSYPVNYCLGAGTLATENVNFVQNIELTLYPNPVTDGIIRFKGKDLEKITEIAIIDMSGKVVLQKENPFKNSNEISVSQLNEGVYFVRTPYKTLKFIKK